MTDKAFIEVFRKFAQEANLAAMREIGTRKRGANSSYGATRKATLRKSLVVDVQQRGWFVQSVFGVSGPAEDYAAFIYYGVKGTEEDQGSDTTGLSNPFDPGYAFTSKQPPTKPILEWLKAKPVRLRGKGGQFKGTTSKTGKDRREGLAFVIARSIKERGIYGLRWYDRVVPRTFAQYRPELDKAMTSDIRISVSSSLTGKLKLK